MKSASRLATLSAAVLLALPVALPAQAGSSGSVSITLSPSNADEARALRLGLALYALRQDIRSIGHVTQRGAGHVAGLVQGGPNNQAILHQEGRGHTGTIRQTGGHNSYGLFQFGRNATAHVDQTGGQSGITLQYGW